MNVGLYQSASALSALERWQDTVSQNITSSQTTAYRGRTTNFSALAMGELQPDASAKIGHGAGVPMLFPSSTNKVNFTPGDNQPTRRPLDFAVQGDGFFEAKLADGSSVYTRCGDFRVGVDRVLRTSSGLEVMSSSGDSVTLAPGAGDILVRPDGTMLQGTNQLGRLSVKAPADTAQLTPMAGGFFVPAEGAAMTQVENAEVLQGYLEASNITPLREMVDLVLISRAYEANQKIITTIDQQMEKTLNALG